MLSYIFLFFRKFNQIIIRDRIYWLYLLKKGKIRALYNYLWARFWVRDIAGGVIDPLFRRFPSLAPYPREIEIEITTHCHLRCIFCEHTFWKDQPQKHLKADDFKKIINQFPGLRFINLTGEGTCFLNNDFFDMIEFLKRRDVFTMFVDSFDLFDRERIDRVLDLGVERVEVSLDAASKETYEKIKVGASWDRTLGNLKAMRAAKAEHSTPFPFIFFRYVVTTLNQNEVADYVRLIADLDMNLGQWTVIEFCGLLYFENNRHLFVKEIDPELMNEANRIAAERNIQIAWSHINSLPPMAMCSKWQQPYIMIGGDAVIDCAVLMSDNRSFLRANRLCNLLEDDFRKAWKSDYYRRVRASVPKTTGPISKHCHLCRGYATKERATRYGIFDEKSIVPVDRMGHTRNLEQ